MIFVYVFLLIASAMFYVLYEGAASLIIMTFTLLLSAIMFSANFIASRRLRISLRVNGRQFLANESIPAKLIIESSTVIPVMCAEITVEYKLSHDGAPEKIKINTPVFPKNVQTLSLTLSSGHYGIVEMRIVKAKVYDLLRVSRFGIPKKHLGGLNITSLIMPEPIELDVTAADYSDISDESDSYSDTKPGDDPSEIFSIHEYADGDKLSKIHWKLTAKQDKLMVKDYSYPLASHFCILADTFSNEKKKEQRLKRYDAAVRLAFALSFYLQENAKQHIFCYFDSALKALKKHKVGDEADCFEACASLLSCAVPEAAGLAEREIAVMDIASPRYSHMVAVCAGYDERSIIMLANSGISRSYTVIVCEKSASGEQPQTEEQARTREILLELENTKIICVGTDAPESALGTLVL